MAPSPAQQSASQRNGALSFGPVTAEGKARSSQNARKHDFFTSTALLPSEDREQFDALLTAFTEEHRPSTLTESRYIREMADAEFRLQRVRTHAMEIQWKTMESLPASATLASDAFDKLANESKSLQLLERYERMFQRQFQNALKTLLDLRKARLNSAETAEKLYLAARMRMVQEIVDAPPPDRIHNYRDPNQPEQNEPTAPQSNPPIRR